MAKIFSKYSGTKIIIIMEIFKDIQENFSSYFSYKEKRPSIFQIFLPLYHEDGDMIDLFVELKNNHIRVCDFGLTLMRLSYSYEIDTPNKEKIFNKILLENKINNSDGNLFIDTTKESLYPNIMHLAQVIIKISNMKLYKREVIQSLFYEMLEDFIDTELNKYNMKRSYYPIKNQEEYEVDFCFNNLERPIFLFAINNTSKARLANIACLKFATENIKFRSLFVLEDTEIVGKKDLIRLISVSDKMYPTLYEFKQNSKNFFEREYAYTN